MVSFYLDSTFLPLLATTMASPLHACLLLALLFLALAFFHPGGVAWALSSSGGHGAAAIPGPRGVLLAFAGPNPHRALASLAASTRGATRLMAFSVGLTQFVVASHPDTAREILAGAAFADRPVKEAAAELMFHRAMGFAPHGGYWRRLRRLASAHALAPGRLAARRRAIGEETVRRVAAAMARDGAVGVRRLLHLASLDNVMASVFGVGLGELGAGAVSELEEMVGQGYELLGTFNWGDHLPLLRLLDVHGVRRKSRALASRVKVFVSKIIEEHKTRRDAKYGGCDGDGDFVDVLLGLEGEERLEEEDMVAVLWEMIFRGTDTVAILLEWVLARMALHPDVQSKAQAEIDAAAVSGDAAALPYLHCVVKECLRMHPPGPLLSWARLATRDAHLDLGADAGGRAALVPAGTTAVVNMWAIARDGGLWRDPGVFRPERFLGDGEAAGVGVAGGAGGYDLRLAPFGAGRRACPGRALAMATVHLWLAQLLRSFRWVPSGDRGVDMSERLGMSLEMEKPLICLALPRTSST
ncbi:cytochrome P450 78A5 [Oryza sativa Japonica Group]|uniref:cytochrome P450 78A5 n=1 Tax=Oryza sativa subsp. japonica TaxID=39947 RepID=UPI00077555DD|nr:cytochrome P450 78A5 [Oryza sativa Japonica Group]